MPCRFRAAPVLFALAGIVAGGGVAWGAPNLDPFQRRTVAPLSALDPLGHSLVAAATPTTPATPTSPATSRSPATSTIPATPTTPPSPARTVPAPIACNSDDDCPEDETICENATCRRIERRTNVFYLYYQEGPFREVLGLYWSKRGSTGFNILAPFYWRFFSPTSRARVVAPLYWHFEDDVAHRTSTVVGLVSWSRQPDAHSFGIWPVFYASTKFGWAAPLLGSFKLADPEHGRSFGAIAYLYWWWRGPGGGAFDLGFPFVVSSRSEASAFTFALPLTFYWRSGDNAHTLAIPLFYSHTWKSGASLYSWLGYRHREGRETNGSVLWLYWFGRDDEHDRAHDVFFPLLWSFRGRTAGTSIFFPLYWDFRGRESRTTIAGLFGHLRDGKGWLNTLFPVWWSGGNSDEGWRFQTLVPFFYWHESDHGGKFSWLTPLGGYTRDDQAQSRTWAFLPGLFFRRDPVRDIDVVTPLYIRHHNHLADSTTRLISLLVYLSEDPRGSTSVLFPVFWRFRDKATHATATALLPFYFHRSGPLDTTTFVGLGVGFYRRHLVDGGWGAGLFPLAFFGKRGDASHAVVFPLFWRFANAKGSTTTLIPLFFANRDRSGGDTGILPALFFFGDHDGASYQVQFPLFWRFTDDRNQTSATVTPLGFFARSRDGWRVGVLPPLLWAGGGGSQRHFVLFPLLWHFADDRKDESTTVALTLLHRRRGAETTDAFFPLFYYRRGARPGGTDETTLTLPLFHYHRDAFVRLVVTPLYSSVEGPRRGAGFIGPYVWYRGQTFSARGIPFLFADVTRSDTGERTRQWGLFVAIDGPDHRARVLLPLYGHYEDAKEAGTYVFPSYFHRRTVDGYAVDTVMPFFWLSNWQGRTTTVIGPWYERQGPGVTGVHNTGLVPLYFWAKNSTRTLLFIPPLLTFHRHDFQAGSSVTLVGLFYQRRSRDHDATVVFPLWWSGRNGKEPSERTYRILAPLYWHLEDAAQKSKWTLLTLLYWSTHGTDRLRALLPVAWYSRDDAQQSGSEAVMPLFYASHGPSRFTLLTLLGGVRRSPTGRTWYAGPGLIYVSDSVERSVRAFFPFYFSSFDRASETKTRVIPPLLHFFRGNPEKSISTWLAVYWRRADVASATTLVLPLFIDVHDYRQSRTTVLLPFFIRHANEITGDNYSVAPFVYRHSSPARSTTVVFPFVWDYKREDRRTTIVFPFVAHWTRPTYAGTYVFPNVYYRKGLAKEDVDHGPDGTWRLFVPPLFDVAVNRPGDLRWEILGGLFGKERIGRNHYLRIFFFTIETQKASAAQTSWYGQPRRIPRAHPARGLATNSW